MVVSFVFWWACIKKNVMGHSGVTESLLSLFVGDMQLLWKCQVLCPVKFLSQLLKHWTEMRDLLVLTVSLQSVTPSNWFFFLLERNCICVTQTCGMGFGRWWVLNTSCPGWRYKTLSKSRQLSSTNAWKINSTLINEKKMSEECSWHDPILDVKNNAITHC